MERTQVLKRLHEELGIKLETLGQYCGCSAASIRNYILGASLPNGTKSVLIDEGLQAYKNRINELIGEREE